MDGTLQGMAEGSTTLRRRKLAAELRKLRSDAKLSIEEAAERAEVAQSTLSRIENAKVAPRLPVLRAILRVYTDDAETIEKLVQLAKEANVRGWLQQFGEAVPDWAEMYLDMERDATEIRTYETLYVPGLLQTEDYAFTLMRDDNRTDADDEIRRRVSLRTRRQSIVAGDDGPLLWFCLDEAVIRRQVGGAAVMRAQLDRILEVADHPRVTLSILPWAAGSYPSMGSSFILLTFVDQPGLVYMENRASALYLERPDQVHGYKLTYDYMTAAADSAIKAKQLIQHAKAEL